MNIASNVRLISRLPNSAGVIQIPPVVDLRWGIRDVVRKLREQKEWSQEELAVASELSIATVKRLESGEFVKQQTLEAVARGLGVSVGDLYAATTGARDDVAGFEDVSIGYVPDDLPVIFEGEASPQGNLFWDEEGKLLPHITKRISRPAGMKDKDAYGVQVRGDSMRPKYEPGDVLVVSPNLAVKTGLRCYIQLRSGERLIKQVRKTIGGWLLESINQAHETREVRDDEIEFMHRIVWAREREEPGSDMKVIDEETGRRVGRKK